MKKKVILVLLSLATLGIVDAGYLTWEHYRYAVPPCTTGFLGTLVDCGEVLRSKYSEVFGIPLALLGFIYYLSATFLLAVIIKTQRRLAKYALLSLSTFGFLFSVYLMYLQLIVIGSICLYCTLSALTSTLIFILSQVAFPNERKRLYVYISTFLYKNFVKRLLFLISAEQAHDLVLFLGETFGKIKIGNKTNEFFLSNKPPQLKQKLLGIEFENPVGLAAGFDYEARLTQFLPSLGFGFQSVGTITNMAYKGNPKPRLGRLPNSKSLMVNKGFKSSGAKAISEKLSGLDFEIPVGISVGRTNSSKLKNQKESVADIIKAFKTFERKNIDHSYWELNISCPNLIHAKDITFYPPKNLNELLDEVDKLNLKKPVLVKMPIEKSNKEVLKMLEVIADHSPKGVIFGNLQKDGRHPSLERGEVKKFKAGFFSGKPTFERSNELISLTYKNFRDRFVIVGCGGIFSGEDAYEKILRGASLVQLITGLIYEGPELIAKINFELADLLERDGFDSISEAVGSKFQV